jgi:magnesium transporter
MGQDSDTAAFHDEFQKLLAEGEEEALRMFLSVVRPEDIADCLDVLSAEDRQRIVALLDAGAAGTVLTETTSPIRSQLIDEIQPKRLARIAEAMPPDDAADLLGGLAVVDTEEVMRHIASDDEEVLRRLLAYPDDTAGGIMNPETVTLRTAETVDEVIEQLRTVDEETSIAALYVVDDDHRLVGYVRLRRLLASPPTASVGDIMATDVISVGVDADQEEVADLVQKFDFIAVPVLDAHGRLVGVVTVDDILEVMEEEATEDIYKMAGSSAAEEESESILHVARFRLPWLLVCLAGTQVSSLVLIYASRTVGLYEQLSVFTAAIMAMAGNTSLQSSTTTVRRLALETLPTSRFARHVAREVAVAMMMGVVCGLFASALAVLFHHNPLIGIAIGPAMAISMSAASFFGAATPMILDLAGADPAVASGPVVSTFNDSMALALYFMVATSVMLILN